MSVLCVLCVSDVRLYVCSGGVVSLSVSLEFSFHCVSASDEHMCENRPQHMHMCSHRHKISNCYVEIFSNNDKIRIRIYWIEIVRINLRANSTLLLCPRTKMAARGCECSRVHSEETSLHPTMQPPPPSSPQRATSPISAPATDTPHLNVFCFGDDCVIQKPVQL